MECRMDKIMRIPASMSDNTKRLSVHHIFALFMDLASEHGEDIGVGSGKLAERGLFWLTVKTKIHINERPKMLSEVRASTWPESPGRIRCNRYYALYDGDRVLVEGKTEWAMIEMQTGKLSRAADAYLPDTVFSSDVVCPEPFDKISEDFSDAEVLGVYKVCSADIDLGQHMNNAAYPRAMLGMIPCKEQQDMDITDAEVVFRAQCYEGSELTVCRRRWENGFDIGMLLPDGKAAAVARFQTR